MPSFSFRFGSPIALVSFCFACLGAVTAISLFSQQSSLSTALRENVASQRAATEMEECLHDLLALLKDRVEKVESLDLRLRQHLELLERRADQPQEEALVTQMKEATERYLSQREKMPPIGKPGHEASVEQAVKAIEENLLRPAQQFGNYNARRIEESTDEHKVILQRLAWGMACVGGLGAVAGVFLGYGVSRGLHTSIRRLAVQIRDAAGMMGDAPEIVLTEEGDFQGLHEQVERLTGRIRNVVQELQQRQREVLRAEQLAAVGQLAAGVAHEIRNPLTSIKMLVQAGLEEGSLPVEDLRVIEPEVRRMERSLQTFLDFARPPRVERRPTSLNAAVGQASSLLAGRAAKQAVTLRTDLPPHAMILVADRQQLEQVLINLGLNALDVMPLGGQLTFSLQTAAEGGAVLQVTDTGPGIAPEAQEKLFRPFASGKPTGLGLGLVISRRIVEDHGGTLTATNRPEGGAVFTVRLPCG